MLALYWVSRECMSCGLNVSNQYNIYCGRNQVPGNNYDYNSDINISLMIGLQARFISLLNPWTSTSAFSYPMKGKVLKKVSTLLLSNFFPFLFLPIRCFQHLCHFLLHISNSQLLINVLSESFPCPLLSLSAMSISPAPTESRDDVPPTGWCEGTPLPRGIILRLTFAGSHQHT